MVGDRIDLSKKKETIKIIPVYYDYLRHECVYLDIKLFNVQISTFVANSFSHPRGVIISTEITKGLLVIYYL